MPATHGDSPRIGTAAAEPSPPPIRESNGGVSRLGLGALAASARHRCQPVHMRRCKGGDCPAHHPSSGYARTVPEVASMTAFSGQTLSRANPPTSQSGRVAAAGRFR
jgi:hypothetical protein